MYTCVYVYVLPFQMVAQQQNIIEYIDVARPIKINKYVR